MTQLHTARLRLEPCDMSHLDGLHAMNADPEVMRYIKGRGETLEETRAMVLRVQSRWDTMGHSWWTILDRSTQEVLGAGCVQNLRREPAPEPDLDCPLEIGWRLRRSSWHRGYATEAAVAMADFAFIALKAPELYSVCNPENTASAAVMQRLGMDDLGLETWYGLSLRTYRTTAERWADRR